MKQKIYIGLGILMSVSSLSAHQGGHGGFGLVEMSLHLLLNHWGTAIVLGGGAIYALYVVSRKHKGGQK